MTQRTSTVSARIRPFVGKPLPQNFRAPSYRGESCSIPKRRPSRRFTRGHTSNCRAIHSLLYRYHPWDTADEALKGKPSLKQFAQPMPEEENPTHFREPAMQNPATPLEVAFDA